MANIFTVIIPLLLLVSCTEEKEKDNASTGAPTAITTNISTILEPTKPITITLPQKALQETAELENKEDSFLNNDILIVGPETPDSKNFDKAEDSIDVSSAGGELANPESSESDGDGEVFEEPTFKVGRNDIVLGDPNSEIVFIEYYSPTCPHCAYYNKATLPELKKKYVDTNKIAYVIREFIGNKQDLDAAILQRCTNNVDSFLKFHHLILQQQDKWATTNKYRDLLTNIGQIGGISAETYANCLKDDKIIKILIANTNLANNSANFIGTPAFFINGVQVLDGYDLSNLSKKIDKALESKNIPK